jgi:hypothetical protein
MLPVPLTSPPKNAVASSGGLQPPPACRITHGPCDSYFPNIAGKTVGSVLRGLATVFSISTEAEAFVGGSVVGPEYRLRAGDWLEFLRRRGLKGALEPEERALLDEIARGLKELRAAFLQTTDPPPAATLTKQGVAKMFQISTRTVDRWRAMGIDLGEININGTVRFDPSKVANIIATRKVKRRRR